MTSELDAYFISDINLINWEDKLVFITKDLTLNWTIDRVADSETFKNYEDYLKEWAEANFLIITEDKAVKLSTNTLWDYSQKTDPFLRIPSQLIHQYIINLGYNSVTEEWWMNMASLIDPNSTIALNFCQNFSRACCWGSSKFPVYFKSLSQFIYALPIQSIETISCCWFVQHFRF